MRNYLLSLTTSFILISCTSPTEITAAPSNVPTFQPTIQNTSLPTEQAPEITATPVQQLPAVGEIARSHMEAISNGIGVRPAGSEQDAQTVQYLVRIFERLRYPSQVQSFRATVKESTIESTNVIAIKYGLSSQEIIVGAHYDSVKVGKGADDNASSLGVLLEVAERLQDQQTPYTIRFILFGAEELGLEGSKYYVSQMTEEQIKNTIAMINLDSLTAGDLAYIYGDAGQKGFIRNWALQYAKDHTLPLQTQAGEDPKYPPGTTGDWSDHAPFKAAGIPYTYLESTNWTLGEKDGYNQVDPQYGDNGKIWHTKYDTLEYIDTTFPGRVQERLRLFVHVVHAILTEFQLPE